MTTIFVGNEKVETDIPNFNLPEVNGKMKYNGSWYNVMRIDYELDNKVMNYTIYLLA